MIQDKLKRLKQSDYYLIKDYLNEVVKIVKTLSLVYNYKKGESEKRMKEIFLSGLHPECQIEMVKLQLTDINDITNHISNIEEVILSNIKQTKPENNFKKKEYFKPLKYCSYHKSNFHSSDECRKYNELKEKRNQTRDVYNQRKHGKDSANIILSTTSKIFNLEVSFNNSNVKALLDTGATNSFVNSEIADKLNLTCEETKPHNISFANNSNHYVTQNSLLILVFKFREY